MVNVGDAVVTRRNNIIPSGRLKVGATILLTGLGLTGNVDGTQAYAKDIIFYDPMYIVTPVTIDGVTIEITGAAAASEKCRIAVYAANKDWQPIGNKLITSAEIAIDANAAVSTALTETTLREGRYLVAKIFEGNVTLRTVIGAGLNMGYRTTVNTTPFVTGTSVAQAYGTLPNPATIADTIYYGGAAQECGTFWEVKTP